MMILRNSACTFLKKLGLETSLKLSKLKKFMISGNKLAESKVTKIYSKCTNLLNYWAHYILTKDNVPLLLCQKIVYVMTNATAKGNEDRKRNEIFVLSRLSLFIHAPYVVVLLCTNEITIIRCNMLLIKSTRDAFIKVGQFVKYCFA